MRRSASDALLFAWAAALAIHPLPGSVVIPRAGAGEWLFPLAFGIAWSSVRDRQSFLPLGLVLVGFTPSVLGAVDRTSAAVQLAVFAYVMTILAIARELARAGRDRPLLAGLAAGALVRAVWGWAAPLHDDWLARGWPRPLGAAETPNMVALQCCAGAIALYALRDRTDDRRARLAIDVALGFLGLTLIGTLGHVTIAALVPLAFLALRAARGRWRAPAAASLAASVAFLFCSARMRLIPLRATFPFLDTRGDRYSVAHTIAIEVFRDAPVHGVGLECFPLVWGAHDDGHRFADSYPAGQEQLLGVPIEPHSTWLGYLAEAGIFGGLVLAGLVAMAVTAARRVRTPALEIALVFTAAAATIADVLTSRELALVIGVLSVAPREERP